MCVCSHSCHPTFPPLRAADMCAADHKEGGEGFVLWDYLVRWICLHCVEMALPFGNKYYPALTYLQFGVPSRSLARLFAPGGPHSEPNSRVCSLLSSLK